MGVPPMVITVPTNPSLRLDRPFHGNRRAVRTAWTIGVLVVMLVSPAAAVPASRTALADVESAQGLAPGCVDGTPDLEVERERDPAHLELDETVIVTPRIDIAHVLAPGDSFTCMLTIRSRRSKRATFQLEPYGLLGSRSRNVAYEFIDADDERFGATAGGWLEPLVEEVTLDPREVVRVPVTITVPEKPPTGSAYGSINVISRTRVDEGETVLGIESQVVTAFLLRVGGAGAPDLKVRNVDAPRVRWNRASWKLTANLDNDGTLHATASGRVRVRSIFGNVVAELPISRETILPGGREPLIGAWKGVPWFGFYRYDVRVENGPAVQDEAAPRSVGTAEGWFIALPPWWVLALIGLMLVTLIARWWRNRRDFDEFDD